MLWSSQRDAWRSPVGVGRLSLDRREGLAGLLQGGGGPHALREESGRPLEECVLVSVDAAEPEAAGDVGPSRVPGGWPGPGEMRGSWFGGPAWPWRNVGLLVQEATGGGSCGWVGPGHLRVRRGPRRHSYPCLLWAGPGPSPVPGSPGHWRGLAEACDVLGLRAPGWATPWLHT